MRFNAVLTALAAASYVSAQSLTSLIAKTNSLSMLGDLLAAYPSVAAAVANLTDVTIFAPNNAAISALSLPSNTTAAEVYALLTYHVVPGRYSSAAFGVAPVFLPTLLDNNVYETVSGGQVIELALVDGAATVISGLKAESTVVQANLNYTGGLVHVINKVLTIPLPASDTLAPAGLTDLEGALVATSLAATVDDLAEITIFAPTNAAFTAIGTAAANLTTLQLTRILEYHIIVGHALYSADIVPGSLPTLLGPLVTVYVEGETLWVNGARVINTDILISGGVIHVIDSVLNPLNTTAVPLNETKPVPQYPSVSSLPLAALTSALPPASSTIAALATTIESVLALPSSSAAS